MKVAFTSCMLQQRFESQPVWQRIQAQGPDHLVLLGNAIHLDVDADPRHMSTGEFAAHAHGLYRDQLAVPEFDALLRHLARKGGRRVSAIWGDHDFLWHDAAGADVLQAAEHAKKLAPSRVLFGLFQRALVDIGSFPLRLDEVRPPEQVDTGPTGTSLPLGGDVWLHLTDGRSQRSATWQVPQDRRTLLGPTQFDSLATAIETTAPGSLHLVASASASPDWQHYRREWRALGDLAARHRTLMLSGGLRHNAFASHIEARGWPLHEATASGAAVRDALLYGTEVENFAIADIGPEEVLLRFFEHDGETAPRRIARDSWALVGSD